MKNITILKENLKQSWVIYNVYISVTCVYGYQLAQQKPQKR